MRFMRGKVWIRKTLIPLNNQQVAQYCRDNGLTITQYEKQVFWADRDVGSYPEPERLNPDREVLFTRNSATRNPERDYPSLAE